MKKLGAAIQYECMTSFKYIWVFYGIQYAVVLLVTILIGIGTGSFEHAGVDCLETNTLIYVGILGALGFQEDFKMLIQNGFTRTYIFVASLTMFAFISGIMALVDTIVGNALHGFRPVCDTMYGSLYGYGNLFANWLWLFLLYMTVCILFYLAILAVHKLGKSRSLYLGIGLGGLILLITALFQYVLPDRLVKGFWEAFQTAFGFLSDGTVNRFLPALTLLILAGVLGAGSYGVIRRTEVKA